MNVKRDKCLEAAIHCERLAAETDEPLLKVALQRFAYEWRELAEQAEPQVRH